MTTNRFALVVGFGGDALSQAKAESSGTSLAAAQVDLTNQQYHASVFVGIPRHRFNNPFYEVCSGLEPPRLTPPDMRICKSPSLSSVVKNDPELRTPASEVAALQIPAANGFEIADLHRRQRPEACKCGTTLLDDGNSYKGVELTGWITRAH